MIIRESVRKMEDIKYFTKQILIEYNNAAIREKRNRAIEEQFLESLQEGVLYPIVFQLFLKCIIQKMRLEYKLIFLRIEQLFWI